MPDDPKTTDRIRCFRGSVAGPDDVHLAGPGLRSRSAALGVLGVRSTNCVLLGNVLSEQIRKDAEIAPVVMTDEKSRFHSLTLASASSDRLAFNDTYQRL